MASCTRSLCTNWIPGVCSFVSYRREIWHYYCGYCFVVSNLSLNFLAADPFSGAAFVRVSWSLCVVILLPIISAFERLQGIWECAFHPSPLERSLESRSWFLVSSREDFWCLPIFLRKGLRWAVDHPMRSCLRALCSIQKLWLRSLMRRCGSHFVRCLPSALVVLREGSGCRAVVWRSRLGSSLGCCPLAGLSSSCTS